MATMKVYRTAIGFHDAYVAAPSQKAALRAWGSDHDLFARKAAEVVTDPALTAEPLASPGQVIKRLRGTEAEQIAALPPDRPRRARPASDRKPSKPKPEPRPSRKPLEDAERAVADAERDFAKARAELSAREAALARERRAMEQDQARRLEDLNHAREQAERAYRDALSDWRG